MEIIKSSRHQKIIGEFGEYLICNWLSRSGFEVARIDHTGIDIIAYNPSIEQRLGITVKSRTRTPGKEEDPINIFFNERKDREKLLNACKTFACQSWIAIYVETKDSADLYLTSLENYDKKYCRKNRKIDDWKMTQKAKQQYQKDPNIKHIHIKFQPINWW